MYEVQDTIVAVSSACGDKRAIIRISGRGTLTAIKSIFSKKIEPGTNRIYQGQLGIGSNLQLDASVYFFAAGHSYTGEDLAEIHFISNETLSEALILKLLDQGVRLAGGGEFTARAYLNGKMDLAQAEAVNKVISCSNRLQLEAAEKLLSGKLTDTTDGVRDELLECLSLLEAGMDFSEEDIEFISRQEAIGKLELAKGVLEGLLSGSISFEAVIDMPSVGIAGAPNAGKSSLLNALLGKERSIVSSTQKTTRDVLTGMLELDHNRCVLFDCAGLLSETSGQIDELAQEAAIEAINSAEVILFCIDSSKNDFSEDLEIVNLIQPGKIIAVATKADLINDKTINLPNELLNREYISVSSENGFGLDELKQLINKKLIEAGAAMGESDVAALEAGIALTARHKQAVSKAIGNITEAIKALCQGSDEAAAMVIRGAYEGLGEIEQEHVDEKVLDKIFGQFCIGK